MLQELNDLPRDVVGLRGVGTVSKLDYQQTLEPMIDAARRDGRRLRFLYELGQDFQGFSAGAAWEDARLGLHTLPVFEACAIVTDSTPMRELAHLMALLMPCPVRSFGTSEYGRAAEWLSSLPQKNERVTHHLIPDLGVVVVEIHAAPSAKDFEALALTADTWLSARGELHGLVIRAHEFPAWENFQHFLQQLGAAHDRSRRLRRVALATDTKLATWAPYLAEHFAEAELKSFAYTALERAISWAAGRA